MRRRLDRGAAAFLGVADAMTRNKHFDLYVVGRLYDNRTDEVVAESIRNRTAWLNASDKADRNEKERAQRRRKKLVNIVDTAIMGMGRQRAEPEEIRDLCLRMAVLAQSAINRAKEDELAAVLGGEPVDVVEEFLKHFRPRRSISVGEDNLDG